MPFSAAQFLAQICRGEGYGKRLRGAALAFPQGLQGLMKYPGAKDDLPFSIAPLLESQCRVRGRAVRLITEMPVQTISGRQRIERRVMTREGEKPCCG